MIAAPIHQKEKIFKEYLKVKSLGDKTAALNLYSQIKRYEPIID